MLSVVLIFMQVQKIAPKGSFGSSSFTMTKTLQGTRTIRHPFKRKEKKTSVAVGWSNAVNPGSPEHPANGAESKISTVAHVRAVAPP